MGWRSVCAGNGAVPGGCVPREAWFPGRVGCEAKMGVALSRRGAFKWCVLGDFTDPPAPAFRPTGAPAPPHLCPPPPTPPLFCVHCQSSWHRIFLPLLVATLAWGADGAVSQADRQGLVNLFLATGGTSTWSSSVIGWPGYANASSDPCEQEWEGVNCDVSNTVVECVMGVFFLGDVAAWAVQGRGWGRSVCLRQVCEAAPHRLSSSLALYFALTRGRSLVLNNLGLSGSFPATWVGLTAPRCVARRVGGGCAVSLPHRATCVCTPPPRTAPPLLSAARGGLVCTALFPFTTTTCPGPSPRSFPGCLR